MSSQDDASGGARASLSKTRLEAFSDGVFAIATTLLVLDIALDPPGSPLKQVLEAWPYYLAYLVTEQLREAVELAGTCQLEVDTIHFHVGDGYLSDGIDALGVAVGRAAEMVQAARSLGCPIESLNVGGGLGVPMAPGDTPLDLDAWAGMLATHLTGLDVTVIVEPGDFLVKEAAVLLGEVVTVEDRMGMTFVGLDMGWNVMNDHFVYDAPFEYVVCGRADAPLTVPTTITGHINEGDDLWAEDYPFPEVEEGEIVACINVGGYNQAMQMPHCLRPPAPAIYFDDRVAAPEGAATDTSSRRT